MFLLEQAIQVQLEDSLSLYYRRRFVHYIHDYGSANHSQNENYVSDFVWLGL